MANAPPDWLIQTWFAGNHSDIGGSYPETESRLSDIALKWMAKEAEGLPYPVIIDWDKLHLFPDAAAMQHCEIAAVRDLYPSWFFPLTGGDLGMRSRAQISCWKPATRAFSGVLTYISRMPIGVQVAVDIPGGRVPGQDDGGYETSERYSEYGHPDHVLTSSPADPLPSGRRSPSLAKVRKVQASYIHHGPWPLALGAES
jgi:hypothetical protein